LIGILSLTQIVDPGLTFIFITGIWWLAGFFNENAHEFCMNDGISILLAVLFYFSSGSIYLNTFKK
jgi:DMSO reductase anchor subunit